LKGKCYSTISVKQKVMKAYREYGGRAPYILNLCVAYFMLQMHNPQRKHLLYPMIRKLCGPQSCSSTGGISSKLGIEPW